MNRIRWSVAAAVLTVAACAPQDPLAEAASRMTAAEFLQPYAMPAAQLTDQHGKSFDLRLDTRDQITLVFFGYTSCPDICPVTMATTARAVSPWRVAKDRRPSGCPARGRGLAFRWCSRRLALISAPRTAPSGRNPVRGEEPAPRGPFRFAESGASQV